MAARIEAAAVRYPLRFVVAGDSGAWPDPTADGIFARLVRQVSELDLKPLFFAHLGDFAGPGTSERHEHYLRLVDRLRIPNVCLVENHDLDDETGAETFIRIHGPFNFTFAHGHTRFVALRAIPNEGPGDKDLAYLHRTLTGARESHRVVLMHMPPSMDAHFEPHREWGFTEREQQFFDLLHEHRVRLVCCAHGLAFDEHLYRHVRIVMSGGAGTGLCSHLRGICTTGTGHPEDRGSLFHVVEITISDLGSISGRVIQAFDESDGVGRIEFGDA